MGKPSLVRLGVKRPRTYPGPGRHTDHNAGFLTPAIMDFGQIVDDLIEATGHKIRKLHFDHGPLACDGKAQSSANNRRFAERGVANPARPVTLHQSLGGFENPTVRAYILTHEDQSRVPFHGLIKAFTHRVHQTQFPLVIRRPNHGLVVRRWGRCIDRRQFSFQRRCRFRFCKNSLQGLFDSFRKSAPKGFLGRNRQPTFAFQVGFKIAKWISK